jgi:hypothetical protein
MKKSFVSALVLLSLTGGAFASADDSQFPEFASLSDLCHSSEIRSYDLVCREAPVADLNAIIADIDGNMEVRTAYMKARFAEERQKQIGFYSAILNRINGMLGQLTSAERSSNLGQTLTNMLQKTEKDLASSQQEIPSADIETLLKIKPALTALMH